MTDEKQPQTDADFTSSTADQDPDDANEMNRRREIKIGSQRDPLPAPAPAPDDGIATTPIQDAKDPTHEQATPSAASAPIGALPGELDGPIRHRTTEFESAISAETTSERPVAAVPDREVAAEQLFPVPRIQRVSADLQAEIDEAIGDMSIDDLMAAADRPAMQASPTIELDERRSARVIKCDREFVFVSLSPQQEGIVSRRQFVEVPEPGTLLDVIPTRYLVDDHLYEVIVPGASMDVQDWSDLADGIVVEARITGHNKGGLECEVNQIRGFIPASQVSLYRVDDLESFVGQSLQCLVTEANRDRRNLVLSHRAVLEREREATRQQLIDELQVGQIREGIVRRLQNFGAFVDIGGIDGLIHVSQLSWDRVGHPSEVLEEGQKVRVRIEKFDPVTGKIGLSYRDLLEDPWDQVESRFAVGSVVAATISKIMDFGAFAKLGPGVEGLIHISEIAHHRVHKIGAFLKEGDTVQVKVLSVDRENQRMSLSIKAALASVAADEAAKPDDEVDPPASEASRRVVPTRTTPLQGGLGRKTGGDQFGLKW